MKRNKYLNTFDTTTEYDNYIESALPEFPNVGLTKDDGELHYMRTSPNDHLFYGELVDATQNIPEIQLYNNYSKVKTYTPTVDTLTNTFYIDNWDTVPTFNTLGDSFLTNKPNIKSIKKFKGLNTSNVTSMRQMFYACLSLTSLDLSDLDTSSVTSMYQMFNRCLSITLLDLSNFNTSNVTTMYGMFDGCTSLNTLDLSNLVISNDTNQYNMFYSCTALTNVYITVEATLMKLTNNLSAQSDSYIPSNNGNCTIHYNDVDYKWQNNAWTPQN